MRELQPSAKRESGSMTHSVCRLEHDGLLGGWRRWVDLEADESLLATAKRACAIIGMAPSAGDDGMEVSEVSLSEESLGVSTFPVRIVDSSPGGTVNVAALRRARAAGMGGKGKLRMGASRGGMPYVVWAFERSAGTAGGGSWACYDGKMTKSLEEAWKEGAGAVLHVTSTYDQQEYVIDLGEVCLHEDSTPVARPCCRCRSFSPPFDVAAVRSCCCSFVRLKGQRSSRREADDAAHRFHR